MRARYISTTLSPSSFSSSSLPLGGFRRVEGEGNSSRSGPSMEGGNRPFSSTTSSSSSTSSSLSSTPLILKTSSSVQSVSSSFQMVTLGLFLFPF